MAQAGTQDLTERFIQFYRNYYREEIGQLAQRYPNEQRSLYVSYDDLFQFDRDLAEDFLNKPEQMREYAEEALRLYDLPADVSLGRAHVRIEDLPENVDIRGIRVHDDHIGKLVSIQGIVRKATDVRPKVTEAAFECQRCGTMTYIPQSDGGFQEPHECQGCERQGPFRVNFDQSEFVDSQKLRIQESPEGLRGGETPQSLDVDIVDDITGEVSPGDHVTCVGVLHIEQVEQGNEKSAIFDLYMDGVSIGIEDEEFEDMDITEADKRDIIELSERDDIYEAMVGSIAPAIYGYEEEKLAMILQLFSGVTKHLPDGSRIRGDLHMLLIGDPGTGKCLDGDTDVILNDGRKVPIRDLVERNLDDPKPVDDGVWDSVDFEVPALQEDGAVGASRATKVWKREAPAEMYRIETASGRELDVTPSHPLFIQRDGQFAPIRAEELETGEFVAALTRLDVDADDTLDVDFRRAQSHNAVRLDAPERWTPALSRLVGYIVAEGYVEKRNDHSGFVSITNNDEEVLEDARNTLHDLNLETTTRKPHDDKSARELLCSAGEFVSFLNEIDEALLKSSAEKRIPPRIVGASDKITAAFIEGFIEGEGHVSASQREISVASVSEELLEGLRSLLLQHGITSQLHERHNGSYRLRISGAQFDRYVTEIGFVTERKQSAAAEHLETDRNTNVDVIPNVGPTLRRLRESLGLTQYECGVPRSTYRHYEAGNRNPSRDALRRIVDAFEDACGSPIDSDTDAFAKTDGGSTARDVAALGQLAESDIRWDQIESIERVEPDDEWVYDLEVEGTHNYVSNGIVSHNSQMISYVENIAPRSVYTSGKGSSAAGLTAAAVRDDFGDGQQWSLEAGALVLADKGIAAVDELDKMDCVTGDALVSLADGRVERIDELAREAAEDGDVEELSNGRRVRDVDLDVWSMDEDGNLVERSVSAVHEYDAPSELTRVTTETGESLTATADHPFFVLDDGERVEREAAALDDGDWVYVPREIPTKAADGAGAAAMAGGVGSVEPLDDGSVDADGVDAAMASVLGYLSGDGNVYYDRDEGVYGVRFTNADDELLDDFERAARAAFDAEPVRPPSEKRDDSVETVRVTGKEHADAVLDAGMNLGRYDEKCFPTPVSAGSRAAKAAFVRALADIEGHVDESAGNVRIASASRDLLEGTRSLLLGFSVSSQLQHRERDGGRDVYYLTVTDADSLAAFRRYVGFTATRKAAALDRVVDAADGDRTILDVVPEVDDVLARCRDSLRLYQSECGLDAVTYHDFETGAANVSLHRARQVLAAFENRLETAAADRDALDETPTWETLSELRRRYHVSQSELAEGTTLSQQQISREWGEGDEIRRTVTARLREVVGEVANVEFDDLREFVRGDVKWRRVESVETIPPESVEHRDKVLRQRLADVIGGPVETAEERARELLDRGPVGETRAELSAALDAYEISQADVASRLDVTQATVSRWLSGAVETDRLDDVREAVAEEVDAVEAELRSILTRIEDGERPRVYDLTVEETHNFVANGLVVHNSSDRSAMHEGLEQQKISVSKAGINATLKARCSLLGAANPKYGRFDQYEPIGEQIDLEPALISRFDLIFTVTDSPDPEHDSRLAKHIIKTNYAGELNTQREELASSEFTSEQVAEVTEEVAPEIDSELLRKYIAHAKRSCYPTMTEEAKELIEEFYVDLRSKGADEDAPVPVTARKLEAMVRLSEASARVRLSDTVEREDADRATDIVESCLKDIGVDPETGQFDADVVETGTSKSQRDRIKNIKGLIADIEEEYQEGAPVDEVLDRAGEIGMDRGKAEGEIEKLRTKGEVYEPQQGHLRTT
ncbi:LAGLIDADG family homing endonuclease [Halorubrum sp. SP9]|uniref:LAGLIDADG family homing endonuclease n=1 Tax=Halorubrum sp. SP9 TaxID=1537267 RepID=UPI0004F60EF7|nr:LAGLIDADG family homing endonuclease [Halorubrum sp. SP9]AIL25675.1 cell division control protein 21 [Halorubrum sp. SP9]TKX69731.1 helix-turn-helix domain-containing protein [Halorubrum sp. SP9]